jgi:hypothetical protein
MTVVMPHLTHGGGGGWNTGDGWNSSDMTKWLPFFGGSATGLSATNA